jgi:di/tricarboxylate transporter
MTALGVAMLTEVSLLLALLFYLPLLVCSGGLSVNEIKRRFPLELMVVVVSAISLATAMRNVGLDDVLAELVQTYVAGVGPLAALIAIFLVTMLLTELVTNNAAAALMFPIALALAEGLGVNIMPFVMAVAFGASASFISPYGYQTNLMVFNAGQYRLSDVVKFGLPVSLTYSVVAIVAICFVFPF